ncbi:MAG: TetR family transcriptional regulator [Rhizobiales bacterium]|nr:TetR family transcriptional regulator [Hyphomicrobiales bacterium]
MANAAKHKDGLVRTAMRLFRQQGYASTGLQQVLTESGVPKGSLYHYFPGGKEQLAEAAVRLAGELMGAMLAEHAACCKTPRAFVKAYCATMARWMEESGFRSGCPIATVMLENAPGSPELTRAGAEAIDHWIEIVTPVFVSEGRSKGEARREAETLIATMEGALLLARVRQSSRPIMEIALGYR